MPPIVKFSPSVIEQISKVLGDTEFGFKGTEIDELLSESKIENVSPGVTKWRRINDALMACQVEDGIANRVVNFIQISMQPSRHIKDANWFEETRDNLNEILAFTGLELKDDGLLYKRVPAKTIDEAKTRSQKLKKILIERNVHPDVLKFCNSELLKDNYFHAVFEATKSIAEKIRQKANLMSDGATLVDDAFSFKGKLPILAINALNTDSLKSEQSGMMNLIKGIFGMFRNTLAHEPKIKFKIDEMDALDILSIISLLHRKLDAAVNVKNIYTN